MAKIHCAIPSDIPFDDNSECPPTYDHVLRYDPESHEKALRTFFGGGEVVMVIEHKLEDGTIAMEVLREEKHG